MALVNADIAALIQEEFSSQLLDNVAKESVAIRSFTTVNMGSRSTSLPVASTLPEAKFVGYDDGNRTKPTSKIGFGNKTLNAAEIAVIVPVKEEDIADASADIVAQVIKLGSEAIARKLDEAIFIGTGKPALWTDPSLLESATAKGNIFQLSEDLDLPGAFLKAAEEVDADGANPDRVVARRGAGFALANARNANGSPVYVPSLDQANGSAGEIIGLPYFKDELAALDRKKVEGFVFDSSKAIIGIRQDVTVKMLDQATVGGINLAEADMLGFRFVTRIGYVLADSAVAPVAAVTPATV